MSKSIQKSFYLNYCTDLKVADYLRITAYILQLHLKLMQMFLPCWDFWFQFFTYWPSLHPQLFPLQPISQYLPRYLSRNGRISSHNSLVSFLLSCDFGECGIPPGWHLCLCFWCIGDTSHMSTANHSLRVQRVIARVWVGHGMVQIIILWYIFIIEVIVSGIVVGEVWRSWFENGPGERAGGQIHMTTAEWLWRNKSEIIGEILHFCLVDLFKFYIVIFYGVGTIVLQIFSHMCRLLTQK